MDRKRKLDENDEAIEKEVTERIEARRKARETRPLVLTLQRLYAEWREVADEDDAQRDLFEREISEIEGMLAGMDIDLGEHSMYDIENDIDKDGATLGRRIRIADRPRVANYWYPDPNKLRKKSPSLRHGSMGEIHKHKSEMRAALRDLHRNPVVYNGGGCVLQ